MKRAQQAIDEQVNRAMQQVAKLASQMHQFVPREELTMRFDDFEASTYRTKALIDAINKEAAVLQTGLAELQVAS